MTVYVDNARNRFGRMFMSHMIADTPDELHGMADKIGVARRWYQKNASWPHYDVCQEKRARALELGAVALTTRELVKVIQTKRTSLRIRAMFDAFVSSPAVPQ